MIHSMERVTATLDKRTLAAIKRVAGARGVSAFLQQAARERLARMQLLDLLDDLDARHGQATVAMRRTIDKDARRIFRK